MFLLEVLMRKKMPLSILVMELLVFLVISVFFLPAWFGRLGYGSALGTGIPMLI